VLKRINLFYSFRFQWSLSSNDLCVLSLDFTTIAAGAQFCTVNSLQNRRLSRKPIPIRVRTATQSWSYASLDRYGEFQFPFLRIATVPGLTRIPFTSRTHSLTTLSPECHWSPRLTKDITKGRVLPNSRPAFAHAPLTPGSQNNTGNLTILHPSRKESLCTAPPIRPSPAGRPSRLAIEKQTALSESFALSKRIRSRVRTGMEGCHGRVRQAYRASAPFPSIPPSKPSTLVCFQGPNEARAGSATAGPQMPRLAALRH
jgi:hypothetical protein